MDQDKKCGVCETPYFERNNYFYGKQLTVRDLLQEQCYLNKKRQLLNRMVLGWGVVCGLEVVWNEKAPTEFTVRKGMALDCCGHEIIVCEEQHVVFEKYKELSQPGAERKERKYMLCLEYEECKTEPVDLPSLGCDENKPERVEYNRVRDGFKLRFREWDEACARQPYGHVGCLNRFKDNVKPEYKTKCKTETIHEHICSQLGKGCPECDCCDCVVLATINVASGPPPPPGGGQQGYPQQQDQHQYHDEKRIAQGPLPGQEQKPPRISVDTCTDRHFVYNNALLYDLIYCHHGDLPHVVDFDWRKHTYPGREVEWEKFVRMMQDGLTVYFDQEMVAASLNRHTFFISFLHREEGTGVYIVKRIPVMQISSGKAGDCYTATFIADKDWVTDELTAKNSQLAGGVDVEITLRGSRIWSKDGKALDGDFLADKLPTGNGTQGGDFVDWFRVLPRDSQRPKAEAFKDF